MRSIRWLWLALAIVLLVLPLPGMAQPTTVQVLPEPGVAPEGILDVQRAVELSSQFFRTEYGLDLTRQVRIIVVTDRAGYIAVLRREFRITEAEAERRARTTLAWTSGSTIVMTVTASSTRALRVFLTAHELVHQLQMQVAGGAWRLYWMAEGVADAVAAQITESGGYAAAGSYQARWIQILRRAERRPDLHELATEAGWFASLDRNGSPVTYAVAGLAGQYLAERSGHGAVLAFFRALGSGTDVPTALQQAFGQTLDALMDELRRYLAARLSGRPDLLRVLEALRRRHDQLLVPVA